MKSVLIVDDSKSNREMLAEILMDKYSILTAENGKEALEIIDKEQENLVAILLDLIMPEMDGYEVLKELQKNGIIDRIPVVIISAETSTKSEGECIENGAADYVHKPFNSHVVLSRVESVERLYQSRNVLVDQVREQYRIIKQRSDNLVVMLAGIVETRDVESGSHVLRVQKYTKILAEKLKEKYPEYGLDDNLINLIVSGSALHDVGKIGIKDAILLKEGRLSPEEFAEMRKHTIIGAEFIESADNVWDEEYGTVIREIAMYHHEKYDGNGYPEGLKGNSIPISAQIVSLADVFDALITVRCYKPAYDKKVAYNMILNGECGQFNPDIIECFKECFEEFKAAGEEVEKMEKSGVLV